MNKFSERLQELIDNKKITKLKLSKEIGLASSSPISAWVLGKRFPNLNSAIKLAEYFNCSLDYLFGKKDIDEKTNFVQKSSFNKQLKKVMKDKQITQTEMIKKASFHAGNFNLWFYKKSCPDMPTVIKLAEYLQVSLDYLAGRE